MDAKADSVGSIVYFRRLNVNQVMVHGCSTFWGQDV